MNLSVILDISPFEWAGLGSAILAGTVIGIERQVSGKPAGMRTSALICLGVYVFLVIANSVINDTSDSSRVIGQIVTGIGFLGAGVMMSREGTVIGVTSAATIWFLAAIGVTIGNGHYLTGIKLSLIAVLILIGVNKLESTFKLFQRGVHQKFFMLPYRRRGENSSTPTAQRSEPQD